MDWQELFVISLCLVLLIAPPILFARVFLWARKHWRPKSEPRRLYVYIASFAVWFALAFTMFFRFTAQEERKRAEWERALKEEREWLERSRALREKRAERERALKEEREWLERALQEKRAKPELAKPELVRPELVRPEPGAPPAFTWPPPPASAETSIPRHWLSTTEAAKLIDVAERLEHALNEAKYPRWSYSSVPNGFALVSQMEQIKSDGTPSPEPARWSTDLPWVANMTLFEFVKALANAQPGYYRVIVFIVTNQPWSRTGERPTGRETEQWLARGFNWLPKSIGNLPYGLDYRTMALVYEFKKASQDADTTFLESSPTSADDHLEKAGISGPLSRR